MPTESMRITRLVLAICFAFKATFPESVAPYTAYAKAATIRFDAWGPSEIQSELDHSFERKYLAYETICRPHPHMKILAVLSRLLSTYIRRVGA